MSLPWPIQSYYFQADLIILKFPTGICYLFVILQVDCCWFFKKLAFCEGAQNIMIEFYKSRSTKNIKHTRNNQVCPTKVPWAIL